MSRRRLTRRLLRLELGRGASVVRLQTLYNPKTGGALRPATVARRSQREAERVRPYEIMLPSPLAGEGPGVRGSYQRRRGELGRR